MLHSVFSTANKSRWWRLRASSIDCERGGQSPLFVCVVSNSSQIVREEEITYDGRAGKWGKEFEKLFQFARSRGTRIKRNFHCCPIVCSTIQRRFAFVIVQVDRLSSRKLLTLYYRMCKFKFLTYHLRRNFSRNLLGNDQTDRNRGRDRNMDRGEIDRAFSAFRFLITF